MDTWRAVCTLKDNEVTTLRASRTDNDLQFHRAATQRSAQYIFEFECPHDEAERAEHRVWGFLAEQELGPDSPSEFIPKDKWELSLYPLDEEDNHE